MKTERAGFHPGTREPGLRDRLDDSYRLDAKLPEPACCPKCGATYVKGRWTWSPAPESAARHECAACRRIDDDLPGGYVTLTGDFLRRHREEILALVHAREAREKAEHPLQRIMAIRDVADGVQVTTTDVHLARGIAGAIHDAYQGDLELSYSKGEDLLRAAWSR
jgi:NMD protein affecting ribosome stability and mRNA decay